MHPDRTELGHARTVENYFALSLLIKDGAVGFKEVFYDGRMQLFVSESQLMDIMKIGDGAWALAPMILMTFVFVSKFAHNHVVKMRSIVARHLRFSPLLL